MNIIELKNITKTYNQNNITFNALSNINLNIKKGELIAIMGPSGAGKSTLLNILGCMDSPTNGEYHLEKMLIKNLKKKELAKIRNKHIGFIFQYFALMNDYSVIENVELPLTYRKTSKKEMRKKSLSYLEKLGIKDQAKKKPPQLSGGQQQRVAIARALVSETSLILADEPTGALDQNTGKEILNILKQINKEGKTVIIVTHDPQIAEQCNRTLYIEDGNLINA